jgi:DNA mismatch repair protein MutS
MLIVSVMSLIRQYFDLLKEYKSKYGEKTFLLLQVGSFFEVYSREELDPYIQSFSSVCDLRVASKGEHFMAGFRDYVLDKYINRMVEESYTVVVFIQEEKGGIIERKLHGVYSPGTCFVEEDRKISNNFACIWLYKTPRAPSVLIFGISVLNIFTGKMDVFEYQEVYSPNPTTYDPLERFFSIYQPTETILLHNMDDVQTLLQYLNIKQKITVLQEKDPIYGKQMLKCESQRFQKEILSKYYPKLNKGLLMDSFFEKIIAFQSMCFLLDYVSQHNPGLTDHLMEPTLDQLDNTLILANHSLKQLNILDTEYTGRYSSVLSMLNTCRTKIGRRAFEKALLQPSRDKDQLRSSYEWIEHCLTIGFDLSSMLPTLCDIEKWDRKRILEKVIPREYHALYTTCDTLLDYLKTVDDKWAIRLNAEKVKLDAERIRDKLSSFFVLNVAEKTQDLDESCEGLIQRGVDSTLDGACREKMECVSKLESVRKYLNGLYSLYDKKCEDAFKFHETDKSGVSIHITKRRMGLIKKMPQEVKLDFLSSYTNCRETFLFHPSDLKTYEYNAQTFGIHSMELAEWIQKKSTTAEAFLTHLKRVYKGFHSSMESSCDSIVKCIQTLDLMNTQCENIRTYKYCKPELKDSTKSYIKATRMRHALIEHIETRETYVPNDVDLGGDTQGILLFGTNAVGKTSYIKSIGICIILAQAGMYVPCDTFEYCPYDYLFTRIIGNDNLFKGLSTFAVEMSELRVILQKATSTSLILGDELCSGTEMDSALSIFVSGLMDIYRKESSFIFATHFHTLQTFEEIKQMDRLKMKHLTVRYNYELKTLIYGRTLCEGPGESTYGLEVCKSLALPDDFLERAYSIRNRQLDQGSILLYKESSYNREKIRSICEFCKKTKGTEIHHLSYQKDTEHQVHHEANLSSICENCHHHIHSLGLVYERRKSIDGDYLFLKKAI